MRAIFLIFLLAGCATADTKPVYVDRVVNECAWAPKITFSTNDTAETKREIIAYETAYQKNCPAK